MYFQANCIFLSQDRKEVVYTRLKYTFKTIELDDDIVAVPVGSNAKLFKGVIRLNDSAAEIFQLLSQETTEEQLIESLKQHYGEDPEIGAYVHDFVSSLLEEGVLE